MTGTPDIRESEIKGFVRLQEKLGGIIPSRLKHLDKVLIETIQFIYELTMVETPKGRRYILETASPVCAGNTVVIHIESHYTKLKYNIEDWIGKDMRPILKFTNGNSVMIGDVKGLSIVGHSDDGTEYTYNFWEN